MSGKTEWGTRTMRQERREHKWEKSMYVTSGQSQASCYLIAQSHGTISQGALWTITSQDWWVGEGRETLSSVSFYWSEFCSSALISPSFLGRGSMGAFMGLETIVSQQPQREEPWGWRWEMEQPDKRLSAVRLLQKLVLQGPGLE